MNTAPIWKRAASVKPSSLTQRQREVAQLIAEGHSQKSMAAELRLSVGTIGNHCIALFDRLGMPKGTAFMDMHVAIVTRWAVLHKIICIDDEFKPAMRLHD